LGFLIFSELANHLCRKEREESAKKTTYTVATARDQTTTPETSETPETPDTPDTPDTPNRREEKTKKSAVPRHMRKNLTNSEETALKAAYISKWGINAKPTKVCA
jgi:hypothetical protein